MFKALPSGYKLTVLQRPPQNALNARRELQYIIIAVKKQFS